MSAYAVVKMKLTEQRHLVAALKAMGFNPVVHATPQPLKAYYGGTSQQKATVIIPAEQAQCRYKGEEIGFLKVGGQYQCIASVHDQGQGKYGTKWAERLTQNYKEQEAIESAKELGYAFAGRVVVQTPEGPEVRLTYTQL